VQVGSSDSGSASAVGGYWSTLDPMIIEEIFQQFSPMAAQSISQYCWDDIPMAVTRFPDSTSARPQFTPELLLGRSAWRPCRVLCFR
jgi:hypothetical protein